ncbi:hypothetical protein QBC43DRAFT_303165 [Cladorrhinum sp. PSN259]|nr:hypothetical protein QBC43DRAFT_303165 [Cladorrhinum sp. PSN259]
MRFSTSSMVLLLGLAPALTTAQYGRCTMVCIWDWCDPICGTGKESDIRCRNNCMDDCENACHQCEWEVKDCVYYKGGGGQQAQAQAQDPVSDGFMLSPQQQQQQQQQQTLHLV